MLVEDFIRQAMPPAVKAISDSFEEEQAARLRSVENIEGQVKEALEAEKAGQQ